MKTWLLVIGAAVVAVGIGLTLAMTSKSGSSSATTPAVAENDECLPPLPPAGGPQPQAVVDQEHHDFGETASGVGGEHVFTITNKGGYTLVLNKGTTSCPKCTLADISPNEIPPGGTAKVSVTWKPDSEDSMYRQTATICTNDPKRRKIELSISGTVTQPILVNPQSVVFNNQTAGELASAEVVLQSKQDEPLEVLSHSLLNEETDEYYAVTYEPIPKDQLEGGVKSGWKVVIALKPGLPLGPINQTIKLETNSKAMPTIEILVAGKITTDISIIGKGWDPKYDLLMMGTVNHRQGEERTLAILVRGPHRNETEIKVESVDPQFMEAKIGEKTLLRNGDIVQFPLTIKIPKGHPGVNRLGNIESPSAKVNLATTHPQAPTMQIKIRFTTTLAE